MAKPYGPPFPEENSIPYYMPITPATAAAAPSPVGSFNASKAPPPAIYPSASPTDYTKGAWAPAGTPPESIAMPEGQYSPYSNPSYAANQKSQSTLSYLSPVMGGFGAGSQVQATPDAGSAVLQSIGSGIGGAASGALTGATIGAAGGPIGAAGGAVIGGVVGLVSGGIQAFTGLRAARAQKREADRQYREIAERENRRYAQSRADQQEQLRYSRRAAALQAQWAAAQAAGQKLRTLMKDNEDLKQLFIQGGR